MGIRLFLMRCLFSLVHKVYEKGFIRLAIFGAEHRRGFGGMRKRKYYGNHESVFSVESGNLPVTGSSFEERDFNENKLGKDCFCLAPF